MAIKVEMELKDQDIVKWQDNNNLKVSSQPIPLTENGSEGSDDKNKSIIYTSNSRMSQRSTYIDLNSTSITSVVNATVHIKAIAVISSIQPANPAKKNSVPTTNVTEDPLFEISMSLRQLISSKNGELSCKSVCLGSLQDIDQISSKIQITSQNVSQSSSLSLRLAMDNYLAEYVLGGSFLSLPKIFIKRLPNAWGLHVQRREREE